MLGDISTTFVNRYWFIDCSILEVIIKPDFVGVIEADLRVGVGIVVGPFYGVVGLRFGGFVIVTGRFGEGDGGGL